METPRFRVLDMDGNERLTSFKGFNTLTGACFDSEGRLFTIAPAHPHLLFTIAPAHPHHVQSHASKPVLFEQALAHLRKGGKVYRRLWAETFPGHLEWRRSPSVGIWRVTKNSASLWYSSLDQNSLLAEDWVLL